MRHHPGATRLLIILVLVILSRLAYAAAPAVKPVTLRPCPDLLVKFDIAGGWKITKDQMDSSQKSFLTFRNMELRRGRHVIVVAAACFDGKNPEMQRKLFAIPPAKNGKGIKIISHQVNGGLHVYEYTVTRLKRPSGKRYVIYALGKEGECEFGSFIKGSPSEIAEWEKVIGPVFLQIRKSFHMGRQWLS